MPAQKPIRAELARSLAAASFVKGVRQTEGVSRSTSVRYEVLQDELSRELVFLAFYPAGCQQIEAQDMPADVVWKERLPTRQWQRTE